MNKPGNKQILAAAVPSGSAYPGIADATPLALDMLQAEARVWVSYIRPLEHLTGERSAQDITSDPQALAALDAIDFTALREFLEIIGNSLTRLVLGL